MFVLGVPIRQKTEVSQQKFVQKHSHQHTFSWFQSVPGKSGHAELVCTDTLLTASARGGWEISQPPTANNNNNCTTNCDWAYSSHYFRFKVIINTSPLVDGK